MKPAPTLGEEAFINCQTNVTKLAATGAE